MFENVDFTAVGKEAQAYLENNPAPEANTNANDANSNIGNVNDVGNVSQVGQVQPNSNDQLSLKDEDLITVPDGDGSFKRISVAQFRDERKQIDNERMMRADYTRKTQELATYRKQVETAYQQQLQQQLEALRNEAIQTLANPQRVAEIWRQHYGDKYAQVVQQLTPQQFDPNEIADVGQVQKLVSQQVQQLQQQIQAAQQNIAATTQRELASVQQRIRDEQEAAQYGKDINTTIEAAFNKNPILNTLEGFEDVLRWKVHTRLQQDYQNGIPADVNRAKELFQQFADEQANKLNAEWQNQQKRQLADKAKMVNTSIEPPGGVGIQPQPKQYRKADGSVDWKSIGQGAQAYLEQNLKR